MQEESDFSKLEESIEGPYLVRVDQSFIDDKTFIAPSKTFCHPLSDDEEEFSLDSLDFNFTTCGETNGRRSIIGQLNHNHNLSNIAADYASTSVEEESSNAGENSEPKEPSIENFTDTFDPFDLLATKKVFNFDGLTPKQAVIAMGKLSSRLETSKTMYPTMIKDNVVRNLKNLEESLKAKIQKLEEERQKALAVDEDEQNNLLVKIIHQLEHKLDTLNERLRVASDHTKSCVTD